MVDVTGSPSLAHVNRAPFPPFFIHDVTHFARPRNMRIPYFRLFEQMDLEGRTGTSLNILRTDLGSGTS